MGAPMGGPMLGGRTLSGMLPGPSPRDQLAMQRLAQQQQQGGGPLAGNLTAPMRLGEPMGDQGFGDGPGGMAMGPSQSNMPQLNQQMLVTMQQQQRQQQMIQGE